jgi:hypothetical protein
MTTATPVETVSSSSPSVKLGPAKAVVAAVLGALAAAVPLAVSAISDGAVDLGEAWALVGAVLGGAGLTGGLTWATPTSVTKR